MFALYLPSGETRPFSFFFLVSLYVTVLVIGRLRCFTSLCVLNRPCAVRALEQTPRRPLGWQCACALLTGSNPLDS